MNAPTTHEDPPVELLNRGGETDETPEYSTERPALVRFLVTDGDATVGPVDGDLLARGISAGRVPLDAMVWCAGWDRWCSVGDYAAQHGLLPSEVEAREQAKLARVSDLSPLQLPPTDVERQSIADARDLNHAAHRFLRVCASATAAECGWVHVYSKASGGAIMTLEGIGPRAAFGVGRTIEPSDQALRVAREGRTVLGEPIPGVVGSAIAARVLATGIAPTSVLMTPVLCAGQLITMLELGTASRAAGFTARDAAVCEQIARDFSAIARKRQWNR